MLLARNVRDTLKKVIKNHPRIFSGCSNWGEVAKEHNSTVPKMIEIAYGKLKKRYEVPLSKLKQWADNGDIVAQLILINTDINHKIKTIKVNPISKMKKIAKKKYVFPEYFLQEKTEIIPITEKIYPFKYKGLNLFVHRNRKSSHRQSKWMVSEKSTGLQISSYGDDTKQEAIERAKKRIIVVSKKQVMKCIKRGLKDLKKITRATKIWEKKTSPKKTIKRKGSKKNPLTVKEIIRKVNVWLDSVDMWLSKGMFGKAVYSYGRAEGYFNSLKKSEQISSRLWNKLKQSGIKLDEYRKTKKSSVKKRSFFKKRNPIPKRDIIEKINHSLDIAERDIQEGHYTGAEYWREKAYILFWETLTAVERTQYMNINDRLETIDYLIKKTERINPGGSTRNQQTERKKYWYELFDSITNTIYQRKLMTDDEAKYRNATFQKMRERKTVRWIPIVKRGDIMKRDVKKQSRSGSRRNPGIDLGATYMIYFDFYGEEMDLVELENPMDYFDYVQDDQTGVYSVERWINGEYLVDYVRELEKTDGVGDNINIVNQETDKEYDGWSEVRKLIAQGGSNDKIYF